MAASKRPSFLKRQKEQARLARASEKRAARQARREARATEANVEKADEDVTADLADEVEAPAGEDADDQA